MAKSASKAELRKYAKAIQGARADFERVYDAQASLHAADTSLPFKVIALGRKDNTEAYYAAFVQAQNDPKWLRCLLIAINEARLFPEDASSPKDKLIVEAQAIFDTSGMLRPEKMPQGLVRSMKQVCRVLVDEGVSQGSGFLVGPQAIITCHHVIHSLIDHSGKALPDSDKRLKIEFDDFGNGAKTSFSVQPQWLAAMRHFGTNASGGNNGAANKGPTISLESLEDPDQLDFAIIRINGTPGRERGYQRLDSARLPDLKRRIYVFQHPAQYSQRFDDSRQNAWHDELKQLRLLHTANAISGSSGGMCTNESFDAVALHQCAIYKQTNELLGNGAIPTAKIAGIQETQHALDVDPRLDPLWRLPGAGTIPVFGREDFQAAVWTMCDARSGHRILSVRGNDDSGTSFTAQILKGMLPMSEHAVIEIEAANIPPSASLLAAVLLSKIEDAAIGASTPLPQPAEATTTEAAWVKNVLFPTFHKRLAEAAGPRLIWFVINDLNHHTIPDTTSRVLLELLYQQLPSLPFLRIMLIGLDGPVPAADWNLVLGYSTSEIKVRDVETWLDRFCMEEGIQPGLDELETLGNTAILFAQQSPKNWLKALPEVVITTVLPPLRNRRG